MTLLCGIPGPRHSWRKSRLLFSAFSSFVFPSYGYVTMSSKVLGLPLVLVWTLKRDRTDRSGGSWCKQARVRKGKKMKRGRWKGRWNGQGVGWEHRGGPPQGELDLLLWSRSPPPHRWTPPAAGASTDRCWGHWPSCRPAFPPPRPLPPPEPCGPAHFQTGLAGWLPGGKVLRSLKIIKKTRSPSRWRSYWWKVTNRWGKSIGEGRTELGSRRPPRLSLVTRWTLKLHLTQIFENCCKEGTWSWKSMQGEVRHEKSGKVVNFSN